VFIIEQNLEFRLLYTIVVFYRFLGICVTRYGPLCENITPSTKPEVHNITHGHGQNVQNRWSLAVWVRVMRRCRRTNKQTNNHAHHNTSHLFQVRGNYGYSEIN